MDTDFDQPDNAIQKTKVYGLLLVACLVVVVAVVLNGLGGPPASQPGVVPGVSTNGNLPQLPTIDPGSLTGLGGVPSTARKAGEILDDGLDVSQQAVDAAGTAVDAGAKVIDAGAQVLDGFLNPGTARSPAPSDATTPPSNSRTP